MENISRQNVSNETGIVVEIIVVYCTLHNFITLHKKGIAISIRDLNLDGLHNVQLYDDNNQIVQDELRDEIGEMLHRLQFNYLHIRFTMILKHEYDF